LVVLQKGYLIKQIFQCAIKWKLSLAKYLSETSLVSNKCTGAWNVCAEKNILNKN